MKNRNPLWLDLNADQLRAEAEIMDSIGARRTHLLTGHGGSGKTTLTQLLAVELVRRRAQIVLTAPTHKAVSVLAKKLRAAGVDNVPCRTIQSLLSLKPKQHGDRLVFERGPKAEPVQADVVVIDECSMLSEDLMAHIGRYLPTSAVLLVGDPAQLPPVGEDHSQAFDTVSRSHLDTIVRQGAGNPILDAADILRRQQGGAADWSWCAQATAKPYGVYVPGDAVWEWMRKGFTSPDFQKDTDSFRFLCWTNKRVADVNARVRSWIYGDTIPTPFIPGERALLRAPVIEDDTVILNTNEETTVLRIEPSDLPMELPRCGGFEAWSVTVPTWRLKARNDEGWEGDLHMVRDERIYMAAEARIKDEAKRERRRWGHFQTVTSRFARLQSIYASTIHSAQGSTFRNVFIDVAEMRRWAAANLLEAQRGMYVGMTRPTHAAVLVGAGA